MSSQAVPVYNFELHQGSVWSVTHSIKGNDGSIVPLTGYTAKMQIKDKPSGTLFKELSTSTGGITIIAALGQVVLSMTCAETAALAFQYGVYDLFLTTGGVDTAILKGDFTVTPRVTVV